MIRVVAVLFWVIAGLNGSAQACTPNANSTFCADGWVAQPLGRVQPDEDPGASAPDEDWTGDGGGQESGFAGDDIYVEGAVTIGTAPEEEPL